jgi:glycerate 2-kinase
MCYKYFMFTPDIFSTRSISQHPRGDAVTRILAAAIHAVEPGNAVRSFFRRNGNILRVGGRDYFLDKIHKIHVLGVGKAAPAMTRALVDLLGGKDFSGLMVSKHSDMPPIKGIEQFQGGHPIPDQHSLRAGQKAVEVLKRVGADDLLICLISGGGSALMTTPLPGLELDEIQSLTAALLQCGARIDEINTIRRHVDQLKGGGVARMATPARTVSLILSDVVGSPLEAIASGITAPDPSTREDALGIISRYGLEKSVSPQILRTLREEPETPKPGDPLFDNVQNVLVGSNPQAAQSALEQASREGFSTHLLQTDLQGEAREVGKSIAKNLRQILQTGEPVTRPFCLVAGGETTVTIRGNGRGGRNQELALAAVPDLGGLTNVMLVTLATDGEDGPTDAAGAVVTAKTLKRGQKLRLFPQTFLDNNDAYHYFDPLGDLLKPGPSGTNVNDLTFIFGF